MNQERKNRLKNIFLNPALFKQLEAEDVKYLLTDGADVSMFASSLFFYNERNEPIRTFWDPHVWGEEYRTKRIPQST